MVWYKQAKQSSVSHTTTATKKQKKHTHTHTQEIHTPMGTRNTTKRVISITSLTMMMMVLAYNTTKSSAHTHTHTEEKKFLLAWVLWCVWRKIIFAVGLFFFRECPYNKYASWQNLLWKWRKRGCLKQPGDRRTTRINLNVLFPTFADTHTHTHTHTCI